MHRWNPGLVKHMSWLASSLVFACLVLAILLADSRPAAALPLPNVKVRALPAFARKYGMPCSSCHEAWPKLSPFGQAFKDNGYQMGNDRDAPIFQSPAYWPVTWRITPQWHRESANPVAVDTAPNALNGLAKVTTSGFDWSGLDFHTAGTLAKNYTFYVLPASDSSGSFHFEAVWARLDNLLGSSWLNIKLGKFELDNLLSEKRILTISQQGGSYFNYHFQPVGEGGGPIPFAFGIGDNQVGVEWMGHSKNDRTRISASLLSSVDGQPGLPGGRGYDVFLAASHAFQWGNLGLQRVGGFAYIGQAPTYFQYTQLGAGVPGTGIGNKSFYRIGLIGMWYFKKLDITTMYFHGSDSAFLGTSTPANQPLPTGAQAPSWNGGLFETHYNMNPQLILINRYELIRMSQQAFGPTSDTPFASNLGNVNALTFGLRYYPFISSRAGFAFHNEYSINWQSGLAPAPATGDLASSSLMFGFDFAF